MTYQFNPPDDSVLKEKVVVLTGGALGVGSCLVRLAHKAGAHVFFGDVLDEQGEALEKELMSSSKSGTTVKYIHCDVTSYDHNLKLFETAYDECGRIDHAVAVAGIGERGNMFDPDLTLESVREEPTRSMSVVDVNLKGVLYFARVASVYLRQRNEADASTSVDKSLTLVSSVAGIREDPGLYVYTPSKHGVMGLMRALRGMLIKSSPYPIRTNAICPWMTKTRLVAALESTWEEAGLPANTPKDVAKMMVGVLSDSSLNGGAMYIEGGRAWNVEAGQVALRSQWIGEKQASDLDKGTALMGGGEHWIAGQQK